MRRGSSVHKRYESWSIEGKANKLKKWMCGRKKDRCSAPISVKIKFKSGIQVGKDCT